MGRGRPRHDDILTPREWQVLQLIRDGLTNDQIAGRLGISLSAAKYHVSEILSKLGAENRREAARLAPEPKREPMVAAPFVWLRRMHSGGRPGVTLAAGAGLVALVALILVLAAPWSRGGAAGDRAASAESPLGPDMASEEVAQFEQARAASPYPHTVLVAAAPPTGYAAGDLALLESLRRVSSLRDLQAVLGPEINLIVVDSSVAAEFEAVEFLWQQLQLGRAVLELNVCFDQVHYRGSPMAAQRSGTPALPARDGRAVEVTEIAPDGTVRTITVEPNQPVSPTCSLPLASGQVPFFAFRRLNTAAEQAEFQRLGRGMSNESVVNLNLAPGVMRAVLSHLDAGRDGSALPRTCEEARAAGLDRYLCD